MPPGAPRFRTKSLTAVGYRGFVPKRSEVSAKAKFLRVFGKLQLGDGPTTHRVVIPRKKILG